MERQDGLYWVNLFGIWTVADYKAETKEWFLIGKPLPMLGDTIFKEIDETPLTR